MCMYGTEDNSFSKDCRVSFEPSTDKVNFGVRRSMFGVDTSTLPTPVDRTRVLL